jgi:Protein of unknown function (DUF3826)
MKKILLALTALSLSFLAPAAKGPSTQTNLPPEQAEANYTDAIEKRTANIMDALNLADPKKAANVHDIVLAQWRALRAWHDENDPKLKAAKSDTNVIAQIHASLKQLHNEFIAKLSENLTPAQIEIVKDRMTHGVVLVTYNAYLEIVPNLTNSDKAKILELLKDGREEAMDAGTSKEKAAIIKKYKGKINNYLDAHGHNVAKAYKDWGAKQKAETATDSSAQH